MTHPDELSPQQWDLVQATVNGDYGPEEQQQAVQWLEDNDYSVDFPEYEPPSEEQVFAQAVAGNLGDEAQAEALEAVGIEMEAEEGGVQYGEDPRLTDYLEDRSEDWGDEDEVFDPELQALLDEDDEL